MNAETLIELAEILERKDRGTFDTFIQAFGDCHSDYYSDKAAAGLRAVAASLSPTEGIERGDD